MNADGDVNMDDRGLSDFDESDSVIELLFLP